MFKRNKIFIVLSVAIAIVDTILVLANSYLAEQAMHRSFEQEGEELRSSFNMLVDEAYDNMLAMATFISSDEELKTLFYKGKQAVLAEGGGPGGFEAHKLRLALLHKIEKGWNKVQKDFKVRQLHFHLAPGATSFLRVHKPEKFGDDLSEIRFTIVDTNNEKTARSGFELGRVYSGLRGVVPVSHTDPETGKMVHIGALEVGTSFTTILKVLDNRLNHGASVLLNFDQIQATMWPDYVNAQFNGGIGPCNCVIHSASRPGLDGILSSGHPLGLPKGHPHTTLIEIENTPYIITHFPLKDYLGERQPGRDPVGKVMFWRDASPQINTYRHTVFLNIIMGIAGFLIIEFLLFCTVRFATHKLEETISQQTHELEDKAHKLEVLAITDPLTGLYNRLHLDRTFLHEVERSSRYHHALSVIMLDIDHFKKVNDDYGHQTGDQVLQDIANLLQTQARAVDIPGRWGGEEFLIICPETGLHGAKVLAEKIREEIAQHDFAGIGQKTASFGVATLKTGDTVQSLTRRVDDALYRAKENGRNQVQTG